MITESNSCYLFIFNTRELLSEHNRLASLNLSNQGDTSSFIKPRQPTLYEWSDVINECPSLKNNSDCSSTSSDRYERDVNVLNRCFDDIEKFIARLQHAAAAFRELEKRRRSRKSKKKDLGDGMLSVRAKPPPEQEFVDIFQKFKLSFNLLAKLKAHIHDPNAPELVHFLVRICGIFNIIEEKL